MSKIGAAAKLAVHTENYLNLVRDTAAQMRLLDEQQNLKPLDSLAQIELIVALEKATSLKLPLELVERSMLSTIESIAALLEKLAAGHGPCG